MKKNILLIYTLFFALLISTGADAATLTGLWRNNSGITVQIIQDENGFRAKRSDYDTWYQYTKFDNDTYADKFGNMYHIRSSNEIVWQDVKTRNQTVFVRVNDRTNDQDANRNDGPVLRRPSTDRNDNDNPNRDEGEVGQIEGRQIGRNTLNGRWFNRHTKEKLEIESSNGAYRVRVKHGEWERYTIGRNGNVLRSADGTVIRMIDQNSIIMQHQGSNREHVYLRQNFGTTNADVRNDAPQRSDRTDSRRVIRSDRDDDDNDDRDDDDDERYDRSDKHNKSKHHGKHHSKSGKKDKKDKKN